MENWQEVQRIDTPLPPENNPGAPNFDSAAVDSV